MNGKKILITGGSGSFGRKCIEILLERYPEIAEIRVFSRDELKHYEMQHYCPWGKHPALQYILGDIRHYERLHDAMQGVDVVVHAAALKHVQMAEANPSEFISTNIIGSENVCRAALAQKVGKVVAISTDKAAAPTGLYGATKLCADKLFTAQHRGESIFAVLRYGNVMGTSGSVVPFFIKQKEKGRLSVTHPDMTRFHLSAEQSIDFVLDVLEKMRGREIFVPKLPSFRVVDLAKAIAPEAEIEWIGLRSGEKLHEDMIAQADALQTIETERYFMIVPEPKSVYLQWHKAEAVAEDFAYNSQHNQHWLSVEDLRHLVAAYQSI
jgi:FlaA1/EpsC-like NDP-sugar epimerase